MQQQLAERSKFVVMKTEHEKQAAIIRADGEGEAARLISVAVEKAGPGLIDIRRIGDHFPLNMQYFFLFLLRSSKRNCRRSLPRTKYYISSWVREYALRNIDVRLILGLSRR